MTSCKFDTFRYVRIKFDTTAKCYTYRCNFEVKVGDRVSVPTCYGDSEGRVMETSADEHWGFPTAKWVHGFQGRPSWRGNGPDWCRRWPTCYRVRADEAPDWVLCSNQTKRCRPGAEASTGAPHVVNIDIGGMGSFVGLDFGEIEARLLAHINCKSAVNPCAEVMISPRHMGKIARTVMLMEGYGMGPKLLIKNLKDQRKARRAELIVLDEALVRAKDQKRLAKIEAKLKKLQDEHEYRARFKDLDLDKKQKALVEEALEIKRRLAD